MVYLLGMRVMLDDLHSVLDFVDYDPEMISSFLLLERNYLKP